MRHQAVAHEEVLKARREQWDNERYGELISNTTDLVAPKVGQRREWPKASADCVLSLAASPTFLIMALLAGINGGGMSDMLCSATLNGSPLTGMFLMYLLMSAFHLAPWLRMISSRPGAARWS